MNLSLVAGIIAAVLTLWFGVFKSTSNPLFYIDLHAITVVCGGTLAAALIAFPFRRLVSLADTFLSWVFRTRSADYKIVEQIYEVSLHYERYKELVVSEQYSHPFIYEALQFVANDAFSDSQMQEILQKRILSFKKTLQNDVKMLKALSKFPPAFGLLGATTGMIAMMLSLNSGGASKVGSAMAIALVATFWGIALANLIFLPLADYANKIAQDDSHTRYLILEGMLLIKQKQKPHIVVEVLKSNLPEYERSLVRTLKTITKNEFSKKAS